ncbi:hypothetical protein R1flu_005363 [Riccia fluitans]|uniref:Uncharacterized protein n=1 Tax=Riccia fluitans TaxID=41844 RepID=A0ABD1YTX6_9MARC
MIKSKGTRSSRDSNVVSGTSLAGISGPPRTYPRASHSHCHGSASMQKLLEPRDFRGTSTQESRGFGTAGVPTCMASSSPHRVASTASS